MRFLTAVFICLLLFSQATFAVTLSEAQSRAVQLDLASRVEFKRLLHYDKNKSLVDKDSPFFLSSEGYFNPQAELNATLEAFYNQTPLNDKHALCRYPARFSYLQKELHLNADDFSKPDCSQYREFRQKVPVQKVSIVFASENTISPSSMMGHLFLKVQGDTQGRQAEHAFSFFAKQPDESSIAVYSQALFGQIDGTYILSAYRHKVSEYVFTEERALWEFEIDLTDEEKEHLLDHIWELKQKEIKYDFIFHNCGKATLNLLRVAKPDITVSNKPFQTPLGHLKQIDGQRAVKNITLIPSDSYAVKMQKGTKNILDVGGTSKISFSYRHLNGSYLKASFMPVYKDIIDPAPAYYEAMETKIFNINMMYQLDNGHFFIDSIDVLKLKSIVDASEVFAFSKDFKFSFENDLGQDKTHLRPTVEFGMGAGIEILKGVTPYLIPKVGYRYNHFHNFYLAPEIGIIFDPAERLRVTASYTPYLNSKSQNRGYDGRFSSSASIEVFENIHIYTLFNIYADTDIKQKKEVVFGIGSYF